MSEEIRHNGTKCFAATCFEQGTHTITSKGGEEDRHYCDRHFRLTPQGKAYFGRESSSPSSPGQGRPSRRGANAHPQPTGIEPDAGDSSDDAPRPGGESGRSAEDRDARGLSDDKAGQNDTRIKLWKRPEESAVIPAILPDIPSTPDDWWKGAGTLQLTGDQQATLWAPVDPELVRIRPDGIVYLPWIHTWRTILLAFAPQVPTLVPLSKPLVQDSRVCCHYALIVAGRLVGEAVGEMEYRRGNPNMSWATCVEGATSDAVTRISKRLSMSMELWDPGWIAKWKGQYAQMVWRRSSNRPQWRRKDDEPFYDERHPDKSGESEYQKPRQYTDDANDHIDSIAHEAERR